MKMWPCAEQRSRPSRGWAARMAAITILTPIHIHIHIRIHIQTRIPIRIPTRATTSNRSIDVIRTAAGFILSLLMLMSAANDYRDPNAQTRTLRELIAELGASDPAARARAACDVREI